ncbi:hypothetical protein [Streptomyces sp. NRRL F-5123]|uniref:hypothetical protein n=1 Tax=Streptomyces sp. NRRL F-5123 TaxID=1463856 RepID=UPI000A874907|nr:hypothetical protein [Streptomyces sp. NRRL F-5123]
MAASSGHASAAYGVRQHLVDGGIVDDLVVLAAKPAPALVTAAGSRTSRRSA